MPIKKEEKVKQLLVVLFSSLLIKPKFISRGSKRGLDNFSAPTVGKHAPPTQAPLQRGLSAVRRRHRQYTEEGLHRQSRVKEPELLHRLVGSGYGSGYGSDFGQLRIKNY